MAHPTAPQSLGMMPTGVAHTRALYTVKQTAQLLSRSEWWVRDQYYNDRIKGNKLGRDLLIPASAINKLLSETEKPHEAATEGIGLIAFELAKDRRKNKAAPRKVPSSSKARAKTAAV